MIVRVSSSGRKASKKQRDKQKAAWKEWCEKYGLQKPSLRESRRMALERIANEPRINKFGQIERY